MNILLINGSPKGKRSNSLRLANSFIDGFKEGYKSKNEAVSIDDERVIIRTKLEKPSKIKGLALI